MIPSVRNDNYHFTKGKMHNILMATIDCVTVLKSRGEKFPVNWKKNNLIIIIIIIIIIIVIIVTMTSTST